MTWLREFEVNGLRCADCANKIEIKISEIEGIKDVKLNFASKKLSIETDNDLGLLVANLNKIASEIESGVTIALKNNKESGCCGKRSAENKNKLKHIPILAGVLLFAAALIFVLPYRIEFFMFLAAYLLIGGQVLVTSARNILRGKIFDENFLMSAATAGAFAITQYHEAVAVMLFYRIGMFFEDTAVKKSRKSVSELMDIRPDFANVKKGNDIKKVSPQEVNTDDIIEVRPGEKIPLDGIVIEGNSSLDVSSLMGESILRDVSINDEVLSGSINKNGLLNIKVTKPFFESTVSKILNLVEEASTNKSKTEKFISKFAKYYTPAVVFSAASLAILPPILFKNMAFSDCIYRALVFLVVSCPCALAISIPLSFFGGIGGASRNGILVKGSNYLEALNNADYFAFDKTGTLTKGIFEVTKVINENPFSEEEVLEYAAYAESYSNHPIALSVKKAYGKQIDKTKIKNYAEHAGLGISMQMGDKKVLVGNTKLLDKAKTTHKEYKDVGTLVYVSIDNTFAGCIVVSDELKHDSKTTIDSLKKMGINKIAILTGDVKKTGEKIADALGIKEVYTNLLPNEKIDKVKEIRRSKKGGGNLVFVGDGINDAPLLAGADIGVAMGAMGSDAAIEAADIVLMTDEPSKLITVLKIAKKTKSIVWQNIIFALGIKAVVLVLGAAGIASMWEAVFADVGVTLITVVNSIRALKI
ncbi:MAG: cadmium-translocating P-type ATPase [Endomicrobium sp.]|jgi:Cd2+/Zn2+-exporting ATPase|nr:cadmium-translocating P-type ATPase [Endomicrobium sp.]